MKRNTTARIFAIITVVVLIGMTILAYITPPAQAPNDDEPTPENTVTTPTDTNETINIEVPTEESE